jgi:hypothetical protein
VGGIDCQRAKTQPGESTYREDSCKIISLH